MGREERRARTREIIDGMKPWFDRYRPGVETRERNDYERGFDSGVLVAAEFVRRLHDGNEGLALELHQLLSGGEGPWQDRRSRKR